MEELCAEFGAVLARMSWKYKFLNGPLQYDILERKQKKPTEKDLNLFELDKEKLEELEKQANLNETTESRSSITYKTIRIKVPKNDIDIKKLHKISDLGDNDRIVAIDGRNIDSIR